MDTYAGNPLDSFIERPFFRNVLDNYNLEIVFAWWIELCETVRLLLRVDGGSDLKPGVQERMENVSCHKTRGACRAG